VTEFGIAELYGRSIRQRARALIDIAAPEFRAELEDKAIELKYL
jgi:acetyl-CoA hydrolase